MKFRRYLWVFLLFFILFLPLTFAATELGASTQNPVVGSSVYIQLDVNYGTQLKIRDLHVYVTYDTNYLELEDVLWIQSRGSYKTEKGRIYVDKEVGSDWNSGATMQFKFKVLKDGLTRVDIGRNGDSHYSNGDVIGQSFAPVSISATKPSTSTIIGTLYVKGYTMQPTFSKTTYSYNLTVPSDVSVVEIAGSKGDSKQTITGFGKKNLSYGDNRVRVVVSAQDGSSRTYEIMIHRTDNRTGDTSLKSLTVSNTSLQYKEGQNTYETTVSRSVDHVLITARTSDPNATLIGTGQKKLSIGANIFSLSVTSSGGKVSTYTIKINRSTEELQTAIESSKLLNLKVNNLVLDLDDEKTKWLFGVGSTDDTLVIDAVPVSSSAKVEILGNEHLKEGINVITIKVTEKNEEITEYTLIVYKNPNHATLVHDINNVNIEGDILYTTTENGTSIVLENTLKNLVSHQAKLYYNVVNIYNGLLYQVLLSNPLDKDRLDLSFKKISDSSLTYSTEIPENNEVTLYLDDVYAEGTNIKIYTYNEMGKYTLLTDGVTIKNGYVTFTTNGEKNYVFTTSPLVLEEGPVDKFISKYKKYFLFGIGILFLIIVIIYVINKKSKQKNNNEPLY